MSVASLLPAEANLATILRRHLSTREKYKILVSWRLIFDPRAFGFVSFLSAKILRTVHLVSARGLLFRRTETTSWGGLGVPKFFLHAKRKICRLLGKNQVGRALYYYYWPTCQNLGVPYPKWMSCKCALTTKEIVATFEKLILLILC